MFLFYDTETTGLDPKKERVVQLASLLTYPDGREAMAFNLIFKCDVEIPEPAFKVHGITDEVAETLGVNPIGGFELFEAMLERCQFAVAFNEQFDVGMITQNVRRLYDNPKLDPFEGIQRLCAMKIAAKVLGAGQRISLTNAHTKLFGEGFSGAHDAMADVRATARVFFECKKRMAEQRAA